VSYYVSAFSWTSKNLAAAIGIPVEVLIRRINFWINKVNLLNFLSIHLGISKHFPFMICCLLKYFINIYIDSIYFFYSNHSLI
jgi:hypothetical protein